MSKQNILQPTYLLEWLPPFLCPLCLPFEILVECTVGIFFNNGFIAKPMTIPPSIKTYNIVKKQKQKYYSSFGIPHINAYPII